MKLYDNGEVTLSCFLLRYLKLHLLLAGWSVRLVKNCDRGLENAALALRPRAAFSSLRSQFFTIRTDPEPFLPAVKFEVLCTTYTNNFRQSFRIIRNQTFSTANCLKNCLKYTARIREVNSTEIFETISVDYT